MVANFSYTSRRFILFSGICALLSVVTTIGIHGFFSFPTNNFEASVLLYQNELYIINRWWVITHCLLVVFTVVGMFIILYKRNLGLMIIGLLFYFVFAITEIFRQLLILFYLNGLRKNYLSANEEMQNLIGHSIDNVSLLNYALFELFLLSFALGTLFYGICLVGEISFSKILGVLMIIWALSNIIVFFNVFWQVQGFNPFLSFTSTYYQPLMRLLIALWMFYIYRKLVKERSAGIISNEN